jgi:IS1 family transposase
VDVGAACKKFHDEHVRNVRVRRLQADEIWCFVRAKAKNVTPDKKQDGWGDVWTWTGLDADTKLCVSYLVGGRDGGWAKEFMQDCARRIKGRVQITTDGHKAYLEAVEDAFGADIDYAQLQKIYGSPSDAEVRRLTNGFSKKIENHAAIVAIHAVYYNFATTHKTGRITPSMAAGLSDHVWGLEEIVTMADSYMMQLSNRGRYQKRISN